MQVTEFAELRAKLGFTLEEAASEVNKSGRQVRRYENGEIATPPLVLKYLRHKLEQSQSAAPARNAAFTFIDLFAGIGGMRLGFEEIGGRCVFTSEWDKYCQKTYQLNFPDPEHMIAGDIRQIDADDIPDHDVLVAGFPCQPFSIAGVSKKNALGRPHGFDCTTQGTLFFEIERIIQAKKPKAFLLENVKNLTRHDRGRTFDVIVRTLREKLGYYVPEPRVISSQSWVPQKRERIFIAGFRDPCAFSFDDFPMPDGNESNPKLGKILQPPDEVDEKYTLTAHLWKYLRDYKRKHERQGNGFGYSDFGPNDVTRTLSARYFKDGSEILIRQKGARPRRLTPLECARLMGFEYGDRKFKIGVSDTQAYKQFGNAVVVPVVAAVARHMEKHILAAVKNRKAVRAPAHRSKTTPLPLRSVGRQYG